jgi:hypothetical protein
MKNITKLMFSALLALGLSTSAYSFEGFSIGAIYSQTDFDAKGQEHKVSDASTITTSKGNDTESVDVPSVFAEYTFAQGSTIGVEYIPGDAVIGNKTRVHTANTGTPNTGHRSAGTVRAKANVSDHITFYVEPTYMMSENFGVYVKGGASNVTVESLENMGATGNLSTYGNQDVWGVSYGAGFKYSTGNYFAKLEHLETEYGTVSLTSTTGNKNTVEADFESTATRFALGYNF